MSDDSKLRETLSALLDEEASELDVQRLLKQPLSAEALATLRRYQAVRSVLAGQGPVATLDISAHVAAALQAEQPHQAAPAVPAAAVADAPGRKSRWQLAGGFAVAASVALAVMFSPQILQPENGTEVAPQLVQAPAIPTQPGLALQPAQVATSDTAQTRWNDAAGAQPVAADHQDVNDEHVRRLNEYLMRHAEHAALNGGQSVVPFARLAGFETSQPPQR